MVSAGRPSPPPQDQFISAVYIEDFSVETLQGNGVVSGLGLLLQI